jgi:hypothetical protein
MEDIEGSYWRKDMKMYGYNMSGEGSIVDEFLKVVKNDVNAESSKESDKLSLIFSRNNIAIQKRPSGGAQQGFSTLVEPYKNQPVSFLEVGIERGPGRFKKHSQFFTHANARIFGVALGGKARSDGETMPLRKAKCLGFDCRKENRTQVLDADESKAEDLTRKESRVRIAAAGPFDIILDDGSEVPSHMTRYQFLWQHVKPGGLYILNDIGTPSNNSPILDGFLEMVNTDVNAEFSKGFDFSTLHSMTFSRNRIVIKKRDLGHKGHKRYRFFGNLPSEVRAEAERRHKAR